MNQEIPFDTFDTNKKPDFDMNQVAGKMDILFICLDTLRWDVAKEEEEKGHTPVLNSYGPWQKCQAPGNFTYPSHHAMFAGFLPCPWEAKSIMDRRMLFFPKNIGMGRITPPGAFAFEGGTIMEGLEKIGYDTWCIGGVSFFDNRSDLGKVLPGYFTHSFWKPSFGCQVKDSTKNQIDFIQRKLWQADPKKKQFLYLNVDAIHYPNWFYLDQGKHDTRESHAAALRYADSQLGCLFDWWKRERGNAFVICCSDHGTCYGEDGCQFHGISHPVVEAVPYKHFFLAEREE